MTSRQEGRKSATVAAGKSGKMPETSMTHSSAAATPVSSTPSVHAGTSQTVHHSSVRAAHVLLGVSRSQPMPPTPETGSPAKRARKERSLNWSAQEITALIDAKRAMNQRESNCKDSRQLMVPDAGKWLKISAAVMRAAVSTSPRDGASCKSKWNLLIAEYKRVVDFHARTGTNDITYWKMSPSEKKSEGLPRSFSYDVFEHIHSWYNTRPTVNPPHIRDLLSPDDSNYDTAPTSANAEDADFFDDDVDDDAVPSQVGPMDIDTMSESTDSPVYDSPFTRNVASPEFTPKSPSTSLSPAPKGVLPPGVTPLMLSSDDGLAPDCRQRPGNTAVRRKSTSGHSMIAQATRDTGHAMSVQIKEMAECSKLIETSKIDMQLRLFTQQMEYQRDRDRRLYESAKQANDNARLSIQKQGEVVQCLSQLSTALSTGLQMRHRQQVPADPAMHFNETLPVVGDDHAGNVGVEGGLK